MSKKDAHEGSQWESHAPEVDQSADAPQHYPFDGSLQVRHTLHIFPHPTESRCLVITSWLAHLLLSGSSKNKSDVQPASLHQQRRARARPGQRHPLPSRQSTSSQESAPFEIGYHSSCCHHLHSSFFNWPRRRSRRWPKTP